MNSLIYTANFIFIIRQEKMRVLTSFETTAISGGDLHTHLLIPTMSVTNEDVFIAAGMCLGILGAVIGGSFGGSVYGIPGAVIGTVTGAATGAIAIPAIVTVAAKGLEYSYQQIGLI